MKIIVDEFNNHTILSCYLLDSNNNVIDSLCNVSFDVAESYILSLIHSYNLSNDVVMIDNIYNDDGFLKKRYHYTVDEFLETV